MLKAGAYRFTSSAQLTGPLTLDAEGDPAAQFVFEIASSLTTASASSVVLLNGASPCNVYWQVGSSATLGTTTAFQGNLMALASISLNNGASVIGRVLARNGQVSLINNVLDNTRCNTGTGAEHRRQRPGRRQPAPPAPPADGRRRRRRPRPQRRSRAAQAQAKQTSSPRATVTRNGTTSVRAHAARDLHVGLPRRGARPPDQQRRLQPRRQGDRAAGASARSPSSCARCPAPTT